MKKAFALLLALCLLCGSVALAESNTNTNSITQDQSTAENSNKPHADTTVQLKVNDAYEVTIPTTLNFTANNSGYTTTATVSLTKCIIPEHGWLKVYITKTASASTSGAYYKVRLDGTSATYGLKYKIGVGQTTYEQFVFDGIPVLTYDNTAATKPTPPLSQNVVFTLTETTFPVSGTYSDKVTFTVATGVTEQPVEEQPADLS